MLQKQVSGRRRTSMRLHRRPQKPLSPERIRVVRLRMELKYVENKIKQYKMLRSEITSAWQSSKTKYRDEYHAFLHLRAIIRMGVAKAKYWTEHRMQDTVNHDRWHSYLNKYMPNIIMRFVERQNQQRLEENRRQRVPVSPDRTASSSNLRLECLRLSAKILGKNTKRKQMENIFKKMQVLYEDATEEIRLEISYQKLGAIVVFLGAEETLFSEEEAKTATMSRRNLTLS